MAQKEFPNIEGSEMVSSSWQRLLIRDNSAQTQFAGTEFPEVTEEDVGRPCYRTDIEGIVEGRGTWFIFCGFDEESQPIWWDLFGSLKADNITIDPKTDFPSGVSDVDGALRYVANKSFENAIVFPPESTVYTSDGVTTKYKLAKVTSNKNTINLYLSGVFQSPDTFDLSDDSQYIILKEAPNYGEIIVIRENTSILEYDVMPVIKSFTGDGSNKDFDCSPVDLINEKTIQVNINGKILQLDEYTVKGSIVSINNIPASGDKIQIQTIYKGQLVAPTANTVSNESLQDNSVAQNNIQDGSITQTKLADNSVSANKIINGSVTNLKLADGSVSSDKIVSGTIEEEKLSTSVRDKLLSINSVETNNIVDGAITKVKLADDVLVNATTGNYGLVTLSTKDEVLNGTGGDKVVTSADLYQILSELNLIGG